MSDDNSRFLAHLAASHDAVWKVARYIQRTGFNVMVNAGHDTSTFETRMSHVDNGDLSIVHRIEVKHLRKEFTSAEDWPFPDVIVCAKQAFDKAKPKPFQFILVNRAETHIAIVRGSTRPQWTVMENVRDSRYEDRAQDFYVCPLHLVQFREFNAPIVEPEQ